MEQINYNSILWNYQSIFRNFLYNFLMTILGTRLKELRKEKGLTQQQLADILHVSKTTICQWERTNQEPCIHDILQISNFFKVTTDYLLGSNEEELLAIAQEKKRKMRTITLPEEEYIKLLQALNEATPTQETDDFSYTDGVHTMNHKKGSKK